MTPLHEEKKMKHDFNGDIDLYCPDCGHGVSFTYGPRGGWFFCPNDDCERESPESTVFHKNNDDARRAFLDG
jgi:hypothetical protein